MINFSNKFMRNIKILICFGFQLQNKLSICSRNMLKFYPLNGSDGLLFPLYCTILYLFIIEFASYINAVGVVGASLLTLVYTKMK